jgi:hypothetical protein
MFVAAKSTAALSHKKPASAGVSCDSCVVWDRDKRNTLCTASLPMVQTSFPSITKTNQLMQSEVAVYCENSTKHK